jgi:hypothetical protein
MKRFVCFALLVFVLTACGGQPSSQEATAQALGQSVALTATAAASGEISASASLQTAEAVATQDSMDLQATQAAAQELSAEAQAATATAVAPILAELPQYGVDPSKGHVGWIHPDATLDIDGYMDYDYVNNFIGTVVQDFVVSADITWNTRYGSSGCGFVMRSDGNEDALSQYMALATRFGEGRVIFSTMDKGEVKNVVDHYAWSHDLTFDWQNDATNRLTIVARDKVFSIYTNGTKLGEVTAGEAPYLALPAPPTPPGDGSTPDALDSYNKQLKKYQEMTGMMTESYEKNRVIWQPNVPYYERGFVALVALSESGRTVCSYTNTWLWVIDD